MYIAPPQPEKFVVAYSLIYSTQLFYSTFYVDPFSLCRAYVYLGTGLHGTLVADGCNSRLLVTFCNLLSCDSQFDLTDSLFLFYIYTYKELGVD